MRENEIYRLLKEAKHHYYNSASPIMSDDEFDRLEDELRSLNPSHEYFSIVGSNPGENKIPHRYPMLSMGKAKTAEDANKWFKKLDMPGIDYCLQPKIDGLSATCRYINGKLLYVSTRGDGETGQDISHIAEYMEDIKSSISFTNGDIEIRGELYLPKDTPYDTGGKALRNNCVGLINRKENREDVKYVRFVCYQIVGEHSITEESEKIRTLKENGFHTVEYAVLSQGSEISQFYKDYLDFKREEWNYETDGIIITVNSNTLHDEIDSRWVVDHHHHYNLAFKPPSEGKETELLAVDWQISRQGSLIPVAVFKPISIGGATLERASLHNYENVVNLKITIGDRLFVERANDVIPYVKENLSASGRDHDYPINVIPQSCPSCDGELSRSGVNIRCTNSQCREILIQQIIYWVKEADIDGVAEGTLRALFKEGKISHLKDLYLLKFEDLLGLEGFGEKKINGFISGISGAKTMSSIELLSRLGIPLVQVKALKKLGIETLDDFWNFSDDTYVTGKNIITWKNDPLNIEFLKELIEVIDIKDAQKSESRGLVCMTGKGPLSRKEIISIIEEKGWEFSSSITKSVEILLCEDPEGSSSKLVKARKLGVKLLSYSEFLN